MVFLVALYGRDTKSLKLYNYMKFRVFEYKEVPNDAQRYRSEEADIGEWTI